MNEKFIVDYHRMTGTELRYGIKSIIRMLYSHQIRYMNWWRKNENKNSFLSRLILYRYSRKYGLEISTKADIDKGLYLGHPYNITVAGGVKIGKNVNLHKGCTIGMENRGSRVGCPTIGDCVYVGINATIVGNITIGNDVMIAANSFVNFDVPDHSIVFGNPAQVRHKENATQGYVGYISE